MKLIFDPLTGKFKLGEPQADVVFGMVGHPCTVTIIPTAEQPVQLSEELLEGSARD